MTKDEVNREFRESVAAIEKSVVLQLVLHALVSLYKTNEYSLESCVRAIMSDEIDSLYDHNTVPTMLVMFGRMVDKSEEISRMLTILYPSRN